MAGIRSIDDGDARSEARSEDAHTVQADVARTATKERRNRIAELVARARPASVEEIARLEAVSASTVRRDLAVLDRLGRVTRTFGGAIALAEAEIALSDRERANGAEKDAIARAALSSLASGQTIFLDAGSTVGRLIPLLAAAAAEGILTDLTIVTNSVTALAHYLDDAEFEVIVVGGALRRTSQSTVGPIAEAALSGLELDRAFLGADGVVAGRGLCDADRAQSSLKALVGCRSRAVTVLADSSKLGRTPFDSWATLPDVWTLVTDASAGDEALAPFRADPAVTVEVVPSLVE
jgi:DeoR/GlpR family transcriptional regulator of sugar metabolism